MLLCSFTVFASLVPRLCSGSFLFMFVLVLRRRRLLFWARFFFVVASGCLLGNTARRQRFSFHYPVRNLSILVRCFFYVTSVCFPGKTAKKRRFSLHYTVRARTVSRFGARVARSLIQNDCRKPVARGRF